MATSIARRTRRIFRQNAGFRGRGMDLLDSALHADPLYLSGILDGILFHYEAEDLPAAMDCHQRARRIEPQAASVQAWGAILSAATEDAAAPRDRPSPGAWQCGAN